MTHMDATSAPRDHPFTTPSTPNMAGKTSTSVVVETAECFRSVTAGYLHIHTLSSQVQSQLAPATYSTVTGMKSSPCLPWMECCSLDEASCDSITNLSKHQHIEGLCPAPVKTESFSGSPGIAAQHQNDQQVGHKHTAPQNQLALQAHNQQQPAVRTLEHKILLYLMHTASMQDTLELCPHITANATRLL